jgi:UDP-glucose:(heptosyl)LPS alpha-1,3-glucosyltransferase
MKGLNYLMKALSNLKKEGSSPFKLLVLGRDRQRLYLHLAKKIGISNEIIFAGSTDQPEKYYGAADLLVHPTFYDPCSLTVLEALASGLPVITTYSNGASRIITQAQEGFVIPNPRDEKTLAQQISFFMDPNIRNRATIAARRLAENYSIERNWMEMKIFFRNSLLEE